MGSGRVVVKSLDSGSNGVSGAIDISTGSAASGASGAIKLSTGQGSSQGGDISLTVGSGSANTGGGVTITAGQTTKDGGTGGAVTITGGTASNGNGNGGQVTIQGGSGSGSGSGGNVILKPGSGGNGGQVIIRDGSNSDKLTIDGNGITVFTDVQFQSAVTFETSFKVGQATANRATITRILRGSGTVGGTISNNQCAEYDITASGVNSGDVVHVAPSSDTLIRGSITYSAWAQNNKVRVRLCNNPGTNNNINNHCYSNCGNKAGSCPGYCGTKGRCCRYNNNAEEDCKNDEGYVHNPNNHVCVNGNTYRMSGTWYYVVIQSS